MDQARRRVQIILDAYGDGHGISWDDVLRVAILRHHDHADLSRQRGNELHKPQLVDDAETRSLT